MINLLSLSQLEHKANIEDNELALAILNLLDEEVDNSVDLALSENQKNDADYSYDIFDAVQAVEWLCFEAEWFKAEETRWTKDVIIYMIKGLHEDTSPYNNQVKLSKPKGSDCWTLEVNAGQYGEDIERVQYYSKGFKDAQERAVKQLAQWIKKGLELNV